MDNQGHAMASNDAQQPPLTPTAMVATLVTVKAGVMVMTGVRIYKGTCSCGHHTRENQVGTSTTQLQTSQKW